MLIPLTAAVAAILIMLFLSPRVLRDQKSRSKKHAPLDMTCPSCQHMMIIPMNDMRTLSRTEMALVVREKPEIANRPLAEYRCPYCDTSHTFLIDMQRPKWVIADAGETHIEPNRCTNCRVSLTKPAWPKGEYDGRVLEAPGLTNDHGLVCARCDAVCCVRCVHDATRNRTSDGSLLCPRCHRSPVDKLHYF